MVRATSLGTTSPAGEGEPCLCAFPARGTGGLRLLSPRREEIALAPLASRERGWRVRSGATANNRAGFPMSQQRQALRWLCPIGAGLPASQLRRLHQPLEAFALDTLGVG